MSVPAPATRRCSPSSPLRCTRSSGSRRLPSGRAANGSPLPATRTGSTSMFGDGTLARRPRAVRGDRSCGGGAYAGETLYEQLELRGRLVVPIGTRSEQLLELIVRTTEGPAVLNGAPPLRASRRRGGLCVIGRRVRVHVHGRVQGVGFRQQTRRRARSLAEVAGWVANRPDGSVEAVFSGAARPRRSRWSHGSGAALRERMSSASKKRPRTRSGPMTFGFRVRRASARIGRMGPWTRSAAEMIGLPVRLHDIRLGRPVYLLLDATGQRLLGFVVVNGDDVHALPAVRGEPQPGTGEIAVASALTPPTTSASIGSAASRCGRCSGRRSRAPASPPGRSSISTSPVAVRWTSSRSKAGGMRRRVPAAGSTVTPASATAA